MPLASSRIRTVHKPTRAVAQSMSGNKQCPIILATSSKAHTGKTERRLNREGEVDSGRQHKDSAVRVRSPPPCRAIFFVSRSSVLNKPSAPSARSTKGRSDHTYVRRNAGGNRHMPWKCPYASGQSFGHGPRQSHKPSATLSLASATAGVAATIRTQYGTSGATDARQAFAIACIWACTRRGTARAPGRHHGVARLGFNNKTRQDNPKRTRTTTTSKGA